MISLQHRFLFIHIPKTAGNAIQNILRKYSEEKIVQIAPHQDGIERFEVRSDDYKIRKHASLAEYQVQLGVETIDPLFKFTCVRNPWQRMISFYFSPHRGEVSWNRKQFIALVNQVRPVPDFVSSVSDDAPGEKCFNNMDFFMRYDKLDEDFKRACERIGIPHEMLPRRNVSNRAHYSSYYDDELIDLVKQRFQNEIRFFGFNLE